MYVHLSYYTKTELAVYKKINRILNFQIIKYLNCNVVNHYMKNPY